MSDETTGGQVPLSLANGIVDAARARINRCRAELRDLLVMARRRYSDAMSELESLDATLSAVGRDAAHLSALRRSRLLQQEASELDGGIARVRDAMALLDGAVDALEGRPGGPVPSRGPAEDSLEAVAIQAQEEERYRLAREIHDGPAQILANAALQLEYISKLAARDPVRARDELAVIQRDLRLAIGEVRRFMYDLRPPALSQQGVGPAVESHCQRLAERFGLVVDVRWQVDSLLLPSHETAVFRIVQEALQNVVKHAQASRAEVRASEEGGWLQVSVADDGKGFDPERVGRLDPRHFGLSAMRARANQIGASLEIVSAPHRGTTILLRVPLGQN